MPAPAVPRHRPPVEIDIAIHSGAWPAEEDLRARAGPWIAAAFTEAGLDCLPGSELSLVFTDDGEIQALNGQYRDRDRPTNVLSFPGSETAECPFGPLLGDIVIAYETVQKEAISEKKPFDHHLAHLIIHGLLHLFGYDHQSDVDAGLMESQETAILARLGIPDPYAVPSGRTTTTR